MKKKIILVSILNSLRSLKNFSNLNYNLKFLQILIKRSNYQIFICLKFFNVLIYLIKKPIKTIKNKFSIILNKCSIF